MKAFVTSIGEPTTDLCVWSLQRNGFDTILIQDDSSLWAKLKRIYEEANEDFLRVDADIIVNRNMTPEKLTEIKSSNSEIWWWQFQCFDWYKQDIAHAMSFMRKESLAPLRQNIYKFKHDIRPETECSRIADFYNPRRFETWSGIMGIHGYGIKDIKPVIALKADRGQSHLYDFELARRLDEL